MLLTELHNQPCYLNFDSVKLCLRKCLDFWFGFGFQIFGFFFWLKFKIENKGQNRQNSKFRNNTQKVTHVSYKNKLHKVSKLARKKRQRKVANKSFL